MDASMNYLLHREYDKERQDLLASISKFIANGDWSMVAEFAHAIVVLDARFLGQEAANARHE